MARIIQITDIHLPAGEDSYRDIPVRPNFKACLEQAASLSPGLIVISGDICADLGEEDTYRWLKAEMDQCGCDYRIMPGNHDDSTLMAGVFGMEENLHEGELYYSMDQAGRRLLFLDTRKAMCYDAQFDWIEKELQKGKKEPIVFMHHPPVLAGVPHMDRHYPFEQRERIMSLFNSSGRYVHVYCGHYHVERSLFFSQCAVHITPSTAFNLDPAQPKMKVAHNVPGYRIIDDIEGMNLRHELRYLFDRS